MNLRLSFCALLSVTCLVVFALAIFIFHPKKESRKNIIRNSPAVENHKLCSNAQREVVKHPHCTQKGNVYLKYLPLFSISASVFERATKITIRNIERTWQG